MTIHFETVNLPAIGRFFEFIFLLATKVPVENQEIYNFSNDKRANRTIF